MSHSVNAGNRLCSLVGQLSLITASCNEATCPQPHLTLCDVEVGETQRAHQKEIDDNNTALPHRGQV